MSDTRYKLGAQELAYCKFTWPVYRGVYPRIVTIAQPAALADKFKALPYINDLFISHSYGKGTNPPEAPITIPGVRLVEVREVNEDVCELLLSDVRYDLAKLINPFNINLRFHDGYLDGTIYESFGRFIAEARSQMPRLDALLAPNAGASFSGDFGALSDNLPLGGAMMADAFARLCEDVGMDCTVQTRDGLIEFADRTDADLPSAVPPVSSYLWLKGGTPTWAGVKRKQNGLPRKIRVMYRQRHAMRIALKARLDGSAVGRNVLLMGLEQRYLSGGKFLTLPELLEANNFSTSAITDTVIAEKFASKNFEGTAIERLNGAATDKDTETVIAAIKRDWRRLYRLTYIDSAGRSGTWTGHVFGTFNVDGDLDQAFEPSGAVDPRSVESAWVENHNVAAPVYIDNQQTLDGARVITTHETPAEGQTFPTAPFAVGWEPGGEADGIIRFTQQVLPDENEAFIGKLIQEQGSRHRTVHFGDTGTGTTDGGDAIPTDWNLVWPSPEESKFEPVLELYVYLVAERQLPNTEDRWTVFEEDGFEDGDVEFADLEVGPELFALYNYSTDPTALGDLLNPVALTKDRARRVSRYKRIMKQVEVSTGRSLGVVLASEVGCFGAVKELRINVDGVSVDTEIDVGDLGDLDASRKISAKRSAHRVIQSGGIPAI